MLGPVPAIDEQIEGSAAAPFLLDIQVADRNLKLPRTWSFGAEATRALSSVVTASASWQHARTDGLFRFVDRNAAALGSPFGIGTHPSGGGINALTVGESSARSRYHGLTLGLRGQNAVSGFAFDFNYTLGFDRSDDDNERDPFTYRYADPRYLDAEYGWSDRDRRHQFNGYFVSSLPGGVNASHMFRLLSASPVSAKCASPGERAAEPADRICADGSVLQRNTLRRDNAFFTWDFRVFREFVLGNDARAGVRGLQRHQPGQLPRHRPRLPALQLRRLDQERPRGHAEGAGGGEDEVLEAAVVHGRLPDRDPARLTSCK